jgi:hypothetical protein
MAPCKARPALDAWLALVDEVLRGYWDWLSSLGSALVPDKDAETRWPLEMPVELPTEMPTESPSPSSGCTTMGGTTDSRVAGH